MCSVYCVGVEPFSLLACFSSSAVVMVCVVYLSQSVKRRPWTALAFLHWHLFNFPSLTSQTCMGIFVVKSARTKDLAAYVHDTWIQSTVWDIPSWSVFRRAIWTNNDVEGWHRRFNDRATGANKPFYELLELLRDETTKIPIQVWLVSEGKLKRCQCKKARVCSCWLGFVVDGICSAGKNGNAISFLTNLYTLSFWLYAGWNKRRLYK
jgi:hypothetical protein